MSSLSQGNVTPTIPIQVIHPATDRAKFEINTQKSSSLAHSLSGQKSICHLLTPSKYNLDEVLVTDTQWFQ